MAGAVGCNDRARVIVCVLDDDMYQVHECTEERLHQDVFLDVHTSMNGRASAERTAPTNSRGKLRKRETSKTFSRET